MIDVATSDNPELSGGPSGPQRPSGAGGQSTGPRAMTLFKGLLEPLGPLSSKSFLTCGILTFLLHAFLMLYRYGTLPVAPVIGDEVIINDPAIALSRGQGLVAPSFADSAVGIDTLYAHFPPLYPFVESWAFRLAGVSVYSLRFTTTVTDLLAAVTFLTLLWCLCRWHLATWQTAMLAAPLYMLNAAVMVLHRIGRMEPMVEGFTLFALMLVLRGICGPLWGDSPKASGDAGRGRHWQRLFYPLGGAIFAGLAMATHPEAILGVIPILLLILFAAPVHWASRLLLAGVAVITPLAVWIATYGAKSWVAVMEMRNILRYNTDPKPGIISFAHDFLRQTHRNASQGVRATLFFLCLLVLEITLLRWASLESLAAGRRHSLSRDGRSRLLLLEIFAASSLLSLIMLQWFVSASITRYEVMFPVYLIAMVVAVRGLGLNKPVFICVTLVTIAQVLAMVFQLGKHSEVDRDLSADRFDGILRRIPLDMRVAATPMLWLAFEHQGRSFTLLYNKFDGLPKWTSRAANPLDQFDAVILDTSFATEFQTYSPFAAKGRTKTRFQVGGSEVDLYLRERR